MRRSAACQPWHEDYYFTGEIPAGVSVAVVQICAGPVVSSAAGARTALPRGLS
jgi:hypothetical protein